MNQFQKCTEYVNNRYGIQPTANGEFIVRQNDGRELSRHKTIEQARAEAQYRHEQDIAENAYNAAAQQDDQAYWTAYANLSKIQLEWQEVRSDLYGKIAWEAKRQRQARRALDMIPDGEMGEFGTSGSPSYDKHERNLSQDIRQLDDADALYNLACNLDREIKQARRDRNIPAYTAALNRAQELMPRMKTAI